MAAHIKRLWMTPLGLRVEYFDESEGETSMSERDTHFQGFANLLWSDLHTLFMADTRDNDGLTYDEMRARYEQMDKTLIAQRAYDLLFFLIDTAPYHSGSFDAGYGTPDEIREVIEHLPDLTEWPTKDELP